MILILKEETIYRALWRTRIGRRYRPVIKMSAESISGECWRIKDQLQGTCFYFTSNVLNMFRTLIYPSSGPCDYSVELPHWSYCSWFVVCWSFGVVGLEWYPCCRLKPTPTQPHRNSNTYRKVLMMDILTSETCWAHKKWNELTSDIKLVFYSSTITMMHGTINISGDCAVPHIKNP